MNKQEHEQFKELVNDRYTALKQQLVDIFTVLQPVTDVFDNVNEKIVQAHQMLDQFKAEVIAVANADYADYKEQLHAAVT